MFKKNSNNLSFFNLYFKKYILSKCINKEFNIKSVYLIHNNNKTNIYNTFMLNYFNSKLLNKSTFKFICMICGIKLNDDTRILIRYYYNNIEYYLYWTGQDLNVPVYNKHSLLKLKDKKCDNNNESLYMLLMVEMKDIKNVYYCTSKEKITDELSESNEIIKYDEELFSLFNKLKGPTNDYGYLNKCFIKQKWIFNDFNINRNKLIILNQGFILEDNDFKTLSTSIKYSDDIIKFDIFYKI